MELSTLHREEYGRLVSALMGILGDLDVAEDAVAVAMVEGPQRGLELIERPAGDAGLARYHLLHAAAADLLRRPGRPADARTACARALTLPRNASERRFLERKLAAPG